MIFKSFISYLLGLVAGIILVGSYITSQLWLGIIIVVGFLILSQVISVKIRDKKRLEHYEKLRGEKC